MRLLKIRAEQAIILIALATVGFLLMLLWQLLLTRPDEQTLRAIQASPWVRDTLLSCQK
ncbi:hypothetical protein JRI60_06345 [Archangium violaceum]|uniref:hypothetical protein n=1 Tax=Archangium violaceum TaxID=83451 RepID=UPI001951C8D2|nr:hypothetical protein [Archangium violaceum]QRN98662.1 hypothetical protein JRI60_06345 [Archangium violaceum]